MNNRFKASADSRELLELQSSGNQLDQSSSPKQVGINDGAEDEMAT